VTITLPGLIVLLVIAAICGTVGRAIAGGGGGLLTSIALGFIGALLGPWVAQQLRLAEPFLLHVSGQTFPPSPSAIFTSSTPRFQRRATALTGCEVGFVLDVVFDRGGNLALRARIPPQNQYSADFLTSLMILRISAYELPSTGR